MAVASLRAMTATPDIEARRDARVEARIVALTANALTGDRERCLAAGMNDHLAKPFSEEDLGLLLVRHLPAAAARHTQVRP